MLEGAHIVLSVVPSQHSREVFRSCRDFFDESMVFATVHLVGSRNARGPFPARTEADDIEAQRRTEAAAAWVEEAFAEAAALSANAIVLFLHANPGFAQPDADPFGSARTCPSPCPR